MDVIDSTANMPGQWNQPQELRDRGFGYFHKSVIIDDVVTVVGWMKQMKTLLPEAGISGRDK